MKIIIFGINYSPEITGIGKYTGEMGSWFAKKGHQVQVVTAFPYYPEWKILPSYKRKIWHKEHLDGALLYRVPLYVPKNLSSVKRILHEFSFVMAALPVFIKLCFGRRADIVFCVAPPFYLALLPLFYAFLKRTPLVNHVQDLQVDAAKELGMINNKYFLRLMFSLEHFILKKSTVVSTISEGMKKKIAAKGIEEEKLLLFPNWVDENVIIPLSKEQSLRNEFGLKHIDKVILYSGNLGEKQGLENIIEIARFYRNEKDIYFLIVGSGGEKEKLQQLAEENDLRQVRFYQLQPYKKLAALLATADVHLVLQKRTAADLVMPSKLSGILAAGGCAIVTAEPNTYLYDVITQYQMCIVAEPESVISLKKSIDVAISTDLSIYKSNARKYAEKYLSKEIVLTQFERSLIDLIATNTKV